MARLVRHRQPKGPEPDMPSLKPPRHISTLQSARKVLGHASRSDIIDGVGYSGHSLDEMQADGLTPTVTNNAIQTGLTGPGNQPNTTVYYDPVNNLSVVVDSQTGIVITVSVIKIINSAPIRIIDRISLTQRCHLSTGVPIVQGLAPLRG